MFNDKLDPQTNPDNAVSHHPTSGIFADLMGASTLIGAQAYNPQGEHLGEIKELAVTMGSGSIVYAVLSVGGFLSIGEKLFAVPWSALSLDPERKRFTLDATLEQLKSAAGFDPKNWPNHTTQIGWMASIVLRTNQAGLKIESVD